MCEEERNEVLLAFTRSGTSGVILSTHTCLPHSNLCANLLINYDLPHKKEAQLKRVQACLQDTDKGKRNFFERLSLTCLCNILTHSARLAAINNFTEDANIQTMGEGQQDQQQPQQHGSSVEDCRVASATSTGGDIS